MNAINPYLKAVVAILGAVDTSLAVISPAPHWLPAVTSTITAILVYLTPNIRQDIPPAQKINNALLSQPDTAPYEPFTGEH